MPATWVAIGTPLVFGHRGGRALAPENTIAAFDRGLREGAHGLELDVRLARDGEVVVCHDPTLDRTTDARGRVSDFTARQLAEVDAGYHFRASDGSFPFRGAGVSVPTLRDVLNRYPSIPLIVEMKADARRLAEACVAAVRDAGAEGRVCLGSFARGVLQAARRSGSAVATSAAREEVRWALIRSWVGLFPKRPPYRAFQVPEGREGFRVVTPRFIRAAHRHGIPVQVWVVNEPRVMARLLDWNVDGLITDRPDVAARVVRERTSFVTRDERR